MALTTDETVTEFAAGEVSVFSFVVTEACEVTIRTEAEGDIDTVLSLLDGQFVVLAENDDVARGEDLNSQIVSELEPGTYYVVVREYNGATGAFTVRVEGAGVSFEAVGDEADPEDDPQDPQDPQDEEEDW